MNHSGIISTSQSQQGIQNVCVRVCVCVCKDYQYFELAASPAFLPPSPFFSVFLSATVVFPGGNSICSLPVSFPSTSRPPSASPCFGWQSAHITSSPSFVLQAANSHRLWENHSGIKAEHGPTSGFSVAG